MKPDRETRQLIHDLGKSVAADLPPSRHATFLEVYANEPHFLMGFNAELKRLEEKKNENV